MKKILLVLGMLFSINFAYAGIEVDYNDGIYFFVKSYHE